MWRHASVASAPSSVSLPRVTVDSLSSGRQQHRRLARADRADDRQQAAGVDAEVEPADELLGVEAAERDVAELDRRRRPGEREVGLAVALVAAVDRGTHRRRQRDAEHLWVRHEVLDVLDRLQRARDGAHGARAAGRAAGRSVLNIESVVKTSVALSSSPCATSVPNMTSATMTGTEKTDASRATALTAPARVRIWRSTRRCVRRRAISGASQP